MANIEKRTEKNVGDVDIFLNLGKSPELKPWAEFGPEASPVEEKRAVDKFMDFIKNRREYIEDHLKSGWNLSELIYRDFYATDVDHLKYRNEDPAVRELGKRYENSIKETSGDMETLKKMGGAVKQAAFRSWLLCEINGGPQTGESASGLGQIYLNPKPDVAPGFFQRTVKELEKSGIRALARILKVGNAEAFNRLDKMTIEFQPEDERAVLKFLENLGEEGFEAEIPRFSSRIKNSRGEFIKGAGFGQNPKNSKESFGMVRSAALAEVWQKAKSSGREIDDPKFDFNGAFREACARHQIDSENPAFDVSEGEEFPEMRLRTS